MTVQRLEVELDDFDEVLLSEEINVLLLRRQEMIDEMEDLKLEVDQYASHISKKNGKSEELARQLEVNQKENSDLDTMIHGNEEDLSKLQKRVEEKKRLVSHGSTCCANTLCVLGLFCYFQNFQFSSDTVASPHPIEIGIKGKQR